MGLSADQHLFTAYDCSVPTDRVDVSFTDLVCGGLQDQHVASYRNATVQVIQKVPAIRMMGWKCSATMHKRHHYCGVYDHTTPYTGLDELNQPYTLTGDECRRMVKAKKWKDPQGLDQDITLNAWNRFSFHEKGTIYLCKLLSGFF